MDRLQHAGREPTRERLARLAEQAVRVGATSGRCPITVTIDDGGAAPDPEIWTPIWATLIHVVRATVNEGLEGQAERVAAGKPARGYLWLRAFERAGDVVIEIEDDGRGLEPDMQGLRSSVHAAGGRVEVDCVPGFGTVIRLAVPVKRPSRSQTALKVVALRDFAEAGAPGSRRTAGGSR